MRQFWMLHGSLQYKSQGIANEVKWQAEAKGRRYLQLLLAIMQLCNYATQCVVMLWNSEVS